MIEFTPAELAALLHEATEPLRRELASALDHATAEHKRATSLQRNPRTRPSISWAWDDAEKHVSELTAELNDTRAEVGDAQAEREAAFLDRKNLSQQLDAATKRAVQVEEALAAVSGVGVEQYLSAKAEVDRLREALAAEKAAHAKTKAQNVPHAPQVGGTIDLEFGDWVQDSSGEFSPVYLNDEKLESTDVCVVRGTGPNARIIWVAGGDS